MIFKTNYINFFIAVFLLASAYFINKSRFFERNKESAIQLFIETLHEKEGKLEKELSQLIKKSSQQNYETLFLDEKSYYLNLFEEEGLLLYIYEKDSLRFWTSNFAPVPVLTDTGFFRDKLLRLKNGWYEVFYKYEANKFFVGLLLLKTEYPIKNKYLSNYFQDDFSLPEDAIISPVLSNSHYSSMGKDTMDLKGKEKNFVAVTGDLIKTIDRKELFYIKWTDIKESSSLIRLLITILNISGFLFLIVFFREETKKISSAIGNNYAVLLFIFSLIGLRVIALLLQYPQAFYNMPLFSPESYATSFLFPSLGDFIINAILIFYISYYLRIQISLDFLKEMKRVEKRRLFYILLFFLLSFSLMGEYLLKGLIEDSSISFNVNNLLELSAYSYAALVSIGLLMFAFFFICDFVALIFFREDFSLRHLIPAFAIASVPFIFFLFWFDYAILPVIWAALIFALIFFIYSKRSGEYRFASIVIIISIFSLMAANSLIKYISQKEQTHRKVLAEKLAIEDDPIAEILYSELEHKLLDDSIYSGIQSSLINYDKEKFDNQLREKFFSGYLSRFDVKSYLFRPDGYPVSTLNKLKYDRNYFERLIAQNGRPTLNENMIHIENSDENEKYIVRLIISNRSGGENIGVMYIALESKMLPETEGFPELLLDEKMQAARQLEDKKYSFAKYRKGRLAGHYGKFNYSLSLQNYGSPDQKTFLFEDGNFSHLVFRTDNSNAVILSKPNEGWVEYITTFSYLFAIFGLLVLLFLNIRSREFLGYLMKNADFNYKVQVMVVVMMIISMILLGLGTSYYIYREYDKKNHSILSEKIHSVLIEVEHKLSSEEQLGEKLKDYISNILTKFSTVFFTDINLYDLNGTLLASSRPKLFDEGIISRQMDEKAYYQIKYLQKSEFIQDEKIGELDYHSAYIPFKNKNGEVLAYLSLPYFARQDTLEDEISSFLVALINIYVFLFAFSLVAALFISNAITRPLKYIQSMLSRVELGKTNKPIEYRGKDEIGRLVKVYNDKVAELEKSAELLAKSERESAWREMAKQVAHEIKNPLTPMKLSVQHLQRALKEDSANREELLSQFTQTMIGQIDALSAIAGEFSNFAKMPRANNEAMNLITIIDKAFDLFKDTPGISFSFKTELNEAIVFADPEQLLRVFINLIQNSIQAIPREKEGLIKVTLSKKTSDEDAGDSLFLACIEDNGTGINPEQMDKIFSPNFTTKTTGMGLGLAMVKSIVEAANGKIWFETQKGRGTTFFIELKESFAKPAFQNRPG